MEWTCHIEHHCFHCFFTLVSVKGIKYYCPADSALVSLLVMVQELARGDRWGSAVFLLHADSFSCSWFFQIHSRRRISLFGVDRTLVLPSPKLTRHKGKFFWQLLSVNEYGNHSAPTHQISLPRPNVVRRRMSGNPLCRANYIHFWSNSFLCLTVIFSPAFIPGQWCAW